MHYGLARVMTLAGLLLPGCQREQAAKDTEIAQPTRVFVGQASDPKQWPYRYVLTKAPGGWSGSVEFIVDDESFPFDTMTMLSATDETIEFKALIGVPGKALPTSWRLELQSSAHGYIGSLVDIGVVDDFPPPIRLIFRESASP